MRQVAKQLGAEIYRFNSVARKPTNAPTAGWDVVTQNGTIVAQTLVNAAGLWGREVGRLAGLELPLMTLEHQYFVTEELEEFKARKVELPMVADSRR